MDIKEHLERSIKTFQILIDKDKKKVKLYDLTIEFYKDLIEDETKHLEIIPLLKEKLNEYEIKRTLKLSVLDNNYFDLDLYKKELKQLKQ